MELTFRRFLGIRTSSFSGISSYFGFSAEDVENIMADRAEYGGVKVFFLRFRTGFGFEDRRKRYLRIRETQELGSAWTCWWNGSKIFCQKYFTPGKEGLDVGFILTRITDSTTAMPIFACRDIFIGSDGQ